MARSLWVWGILFVKFVTCKAQIAPLYPDIPATYSFNMPLVTPAYIPLEGKYILGSIYKFKLKESNLAIFDMNAAIVFDGKGQNKQLVRLNFSNEKEGPYISTSRASANYAYKLALTHDLNMSAGLSLGFVNRIYMTPSSSNQGSFFLPDGNIGLTINYKELEIGSALMQFPNSKETPLQSTQQAKRFYHMYGMYKHDISPYWSLKEYMLVRVLPEITTQLIGGFNIIYQDMYEAGFVYYQRRGITFQLVYGLPGEKYPLALSMAYNSSLLTQSPLWVDSFELGLKVRINKKKESGLTIGKL
ncbi:type IX secretion system membrane protein PorP/SprF [Sporocytophaga myxococcoides]|uniref:type IX secretion system membrane protein PorP/SprF n=1 Tax=Sporocytophaga myxococcoides TaxID=153721 RepID=UPI00041952E6|nr:type IX secretion system membrane protein PorP/SprF [Sporocytophaga myxococcoides]